MAIAQDASQDSPRIPAWKRIGLKLKYAEDSNASGTQSIPNESLRPTLDISLNQSQKRLLDGAEPATPAKRGKISASSKEYETSASPRLVAGTSNVQNGKQNRSSYGFGGVSNLEVAATPKKIVFDDADGSIEEGQQENRAKSPRKSVSFTPDTKTDDGFSASNLFKAWAAGEQPVSNSNSDEQATNTKPDDQAGATKQVGSKSERPAEKKKKKKKSKSTLIESPQPATDAKATTTKARDDGAASQEAAPYYLQYLQQFNSDRSNWKFNKSQQNGLLKNLFNIYRIPPQHNAKLVQYISGLKGSARGRIAEEADNALRNIWEAHHQDSESLNMTNSRECRNAYLQVLETQIGRFEAASSSTIKESGQELEDMRREIEQGKRAKALLQEAFGNELFTMPHSNSSSTDTPVDKVFEAIPSSNSTDKAKRRKRKARVEILSSSSETSSSSSSSSENSEDSD